MKVILTCDPELPVPPKLYGGIERIVEAVVLNLSDMGVEVTLCANHESTVPCRLVGWKGKKSQNSRDILLNAWQLTNLVRREKFDIVHSFSRLAYMTAIMPFGIKKIMSYQREPSAKQIAKAVSLSKKDTIYFTGCSKYISDQISKVSAAHTIYNCIPIEKYHGTLQVDSNAPLVFLGRIEEIKGPHIAVQIALLTGKKLVLAGNIPEDKYSFFTEKIQPFLNENITYIGPVTDVQKNDLLGKASALLMPIQWSEPFGIVMAEAMACGTPVIGFPYGSVPEIVIHNVNGFICQNIDEMAEAVKQVHTLDRQRVREIAQEKYSSKKITDDYLKLYKKILNTQL